MKPGIFVIYYFKFLWLADFLSFIVRIALECRFSGQTPDSIYANSVYELLLSEMRILSFNAAHSCIISNIIMKYDIRINC